VFALAALFGLVAVAIPSLRGEIPLPPRPPDTTALAPPPIEPAPPAPSPAPAPQPRAPVSVHVNATPWAEINVDGVDVGVTPLAGLPLLPGRHTFQARMPDGRVLEQVVEIGPGARHVAFGP
jgi:hypothetical protein